MSEQGIRLVQATSECDVCDKRFHQIDSSDERALAVVRGALDKHRAAEHALAPRVVRDDGGEGSGE